MRRIHRSHAIGGAHGSTMVVMFVDCCVGGGRYFPYYSYRRNPTGREFFIPAETLIAVKLLIEKRSASQCIYFVRSKLFFTLHLSTLYIPLAHYRSTDSQSQLFLKKIKSFLCKQELVNIRSFLSKKVPPASSLSKSMKTTCQPRYVSHKI